MEKPVDYHGRVEFLPKENKWRFTTSPVVARRLLRLFTSAREPSKVGSVRTVLIPHNLDNAEDVEWVLARYPHEMSRDQQGLLRTLTRAHRSSYAAAKEIMQRAEIAQPAEIAGSAPLRKYQLQAVELAGLKRGILVGDDMGLGKTATAIGILAKQGARPGLVCCAPHVQQQWVDQVAKFAPGLRCHIVRSRKEYLMPRHDIAIITYSKLEAWAGKYPWKAVVYDEVQELRRGDETGKGKGAKILGEQCEYRIGLSATPIYNYANEAYHVFNFLAPGHLGTYGEFVSEWGDGQNGRVRDAEALGAWLRSEQIYLRRTRADVGRELPEVNKVTHMIDFRAEALERLKTPALALARSVLQGAFTERGKSARQLDIMLRQATGIGKAPFAADFVADLIEGGEPKILLGAWHREVYTVLLEEFSRRGISAVLYSGSESAAGKIAAAKEFIEGDAKVMIMSLRSGAGLDGLQEVCKTVAFVELDWSPKVHQQFIGRVNRDREDGKPNQVSAFYLLAEDGSDPIIANVLGIKDRQSTAVTDPDLLAKLHTVAKDAPDDGDEAANHRGRFMANKILETWK